MYWRVAPAKPVSASTRCGRCAAAAVSRRGNELLSRIRKNSNARMNARSETTLVAPVTTRCNRPIRLFRSNWLTAALICSWVTPRSPSHPVNWSIRLVNCGW